MHIFLLGSCEMLPMFELIWTPETLCFSNKKFELKVIVKIIVGSTKPVRNYISKYFQIFQKPDLHMGFESIFLAQKT